LASGGASPLVLIYMLLLTAQWFPTVHLTVCQVWWQPSFAC